MRNWLVVAALGEFMRSSITILVALLLLFASNASAQKGDWTTVEELPYGTPISVLYGGFPIHNPCTFQNAVNDKLMCRRQLSRSGRIFIPPGAIYFRKQIRAVRLEYSDTHNELVGFAIGGAIGGALGASGSGDPRGRFAAGLIIGIGGGALGALLGRDFPIFHRKTSYHQ
jgi:hypothetical protein